MEKNKNTPPKQDKTGNKPNQNENKDYRKKEIDPNNPVAGKGKQNDNKNTSTGQKGR